MFHFGFSYVGLIYLLMLFIPNGIWTKHKPLGYDNYVKDESKILLAFERCGQVLATVLCLIFSDFNIRNSYWSVWLIAATVLMVLYEIFWIRYFMSKKTMADFYGNLLFIPIPGASLPVVALFCLAIYGSNIFLIIASAILGIGHIGIHREHARVFVTEKKKPVIFKVISKIVTVMVSVVCIVIVSVIACRNIRFILESRHAFGGVCESTYVTLGGQEQHVLIRGNDVDNPVIVYLHGGPSSPDAYITYAFADYLLDDYTFIAWDQRGCGSTYIKNAKTDPENQTATYEQAQCDLDELVDYACNRFGKNKVIIMGWSYGTLLGTDYVLTHPDKVTAYVGIGQFVSLEKSDVHSYNDALKMARALGEDTTSLEAAYEQYDKDKSLSSLMELRQYTMPYHPQEITGNTTLLSVVSPYFTMADFEWFLKQLGDFDSYYKLNQQLFDYALSTDLYDRDMQFEVPMYYISGACDWVCCADMAQSYASQVSTPNKRFMLIEGCGHGVQYDEPQYFAEMAKLFLGSVY